MDKPQLTITQYFCNYLSINSIKYQVDNNNIIFEQDGVQIIFEPYQDPNYFRLIIPLPNVENTHENQARMENINREIRVVKAIRQENSSVILVAEHYVYSDGGIYLLFDRLIRLLLHTFHTPRYHLN